MIIHSPIISGSLTFADGSTLSLPPGSVYSGSFSGSYQGDTFAGGVFTGDGSGLTFNGTGIISSSAQLSADFLDTLGDGVISGSSQVEFNDVNNTPFSQSASSVTVSKSIVPSSLTLDLGSSASPFRDLYLSSASLYIDGQQVISSNTNELTITTDTNQSLKLVETGADTITLQAQNGDITLTTTGTGNIELDAPVQIAAGNQILSSDGNAIQFGEDINVQGNITVTGTVDGVDIAALNNKTLVSGSAQVVSALNGQNVNLGGISGSSLDITGNAKIDGNLVLGGNLTIGDTSSDTITFAGDISSDIIPSANNTYDLGSSTDKFAEIHATNLYGTLSGNLNSTNGVVSSSAQISSYGVFAELNGDSIVSGSSQIVLESADKTGFTGASSITTLGTIGTGVWQGSIIASQYLDADPLPAGTISGSAQVDHDQTTNFVAGEHFLQSEITEVGTVTAGSVTAILPSGTVSSSEQIDFATIQPIGVISSSEQVEDIVGGMVSGNTETGIAVTYQDTDGTIDYVVQYGSTANTAVQGNTSLSFAGTSNEISIDGGSSITLGSGGTVTIGLADTIAGNRTFSNNVTITGDLTVNGTTTTVNSNTVNIGDNILVLNSDEAGTPSQNGGIEIERGTSTNSTLLWDEGNDYWVAGLAGAEERIVIGAGNTSITTLGTITTGTWNATSISTTYTDAKVTSIVAGTGISISGGTGDVTVTNSDRGSSQNIFKTVAVSGQSNIVADSNSDTLTFAAGSNVTLTTNASTDTITIASSYTDTTYSAGTGITLTGTTFSTNDSQIVHDSLSGFVGNEHINHANVSISAGTGLSGGGDITTSRTLSLSHLGLESLTDPNADRVAFWDDSAGAFAWLTMGSNLSISGTTLNATDTNTTYSVSDTSGQTGIDLTLTGTTISGVTSGLTTSSTVQFAKVGVGTAADATYELKVSGDIGATGDIVAYISSDERLKDNIELISNPIEKVQSLRGVTWDWNDNASEAAKQSPNVGVIAQEVEKVLPQLVHDRENGYKGVDYAKLTGLLIEAIKDQQKQIDDLKSKLG